MYIYTYFNFFLMAFVSDVIKNIDKKIEKDIMLLLVYSTRKYAQPWVTLRYYVSTCLIEANDLG